MNLRKNASIFQAEAAAIQAAAENMLENTTPKTKYIRIFSDSQAVLKALDKDTIKSRTILNARLALNKLSHQIHTLTLVWIKAHHGLEGNELADEYAKQGTIDTSNYRFSHTTRTEFKNIIETKSNEIWCRKWEKYKHCKLSLIHI